MDRATLAALDANYLDANRAFMACSTTGEYVERRDAAIVCCGLPAEAFNWGFLKPPHDEPGATAARIRAYFAARKLPFQLQARAGDRACAKELAACGWRRRQDPVPGMALAIPSSFPPRLAGLAIEQVRTPGRLAAFAETAFRGFGYPPTGAGIFLNDRLLAWPRVRLFAGLVGGVAVATSMLIATGDVAGIYWVATLEEHRGRGYGEALTWAAAAGGRELGCGIASLQASRMGRPVYARMGFEHVLDYECFLPPEA